MLLFYVSPTTDTPPEPAAAVREPLTTEQLFSFLLPHASKWRELGIALSLDEDRLDDEVFPNNETDEACLQEMIELYMMRSDLDHSWEKIEAALQKIIMSSEFSSLHCILKGELCYGYACVQNLLLPLLCPPILRRFGALFCH